MLFSVVLHIRVPRSVFLTLFKRATLYVEVLVNYLGFKVEIHSNSNRNLRDNYPNVWETFELLMSCLKRFGVDMTI